MKPFFTYYGGKWRAAPSYPHPAHATIVEPFAGSAGYAMRYSDRNVILVEKNAGLCEVWRYLIRTPAAEIRSLPLLEAGQSRHDLNVSEGAGLLIGWNLNKGGASPTNTPSLWMRNTKYAYQFWGEERRERVAQQVDRIRHWQVIEGDYTRAPNIRATWFVDPPYQRQGRYYRHPSGALAFDALGEWCVSRDGQTIVCENVGASWLPFVPFRDIKANEARQSGKVSREAIYLQQRGA